MGWLSLCVCGTDSKSLDDKKNEKRKFDNDKKSKKSKKNCKQKEAHKTQLFSIDESLRKSQEQFEKEIANTEWINGEVENYLDDCAKNQTDADRQSINSRRNDIISSNFWSPQIDGENFNDSRKNLDRNMDSIDQKTHDDSNTLYLKCVPRIDNDDKQVMCVNRKGHDEEETNFDKSSSKSANPEEAEDSSWTSEIDDRDDPAVKSSFDRKFIERTSSRINFSTKKQEKSRAKVSPRKGSKRVLPPIKKKSSVKTDNLCLKDEVQECNKFGFKRSTTTTVSRKQSEVQQKLNSCSDEVRSSEAGERSGKARSRGEGSLIPRLASPMRQGMNSIKNDNDEVQVKQNGIISFRTKKGNYITLFEEGNET